MLASSFSKLESNEVALRRHRHWGYQVGDGVEKNGLHYVGLWHAFERVSKTDQFASYGVTAFTSNLIRVNMDVSIQYQVEPTYTNLYKIIFDYDSMKEYFNFRVTDAVRRSVQSIGSDVLYSNRGYVTGVLRDFTTRAIVDCGYSLTNLQIREITVPDDMQNAIDALVDAKLDIDVALNERSKTTQDAENQKNRDIYNVNIHAELQIQSAYADYNASKEILDAQLYSLQRQVNNTEALIIAYKGQYPAANYLTIMELVKAHRYNTLVQTIGSSGSNKVVLDHKPTAIGAFGDEIKARLVSAENGRRQLREELWVNQNCLILGMDSHQTGSREVHQRYTTRKRLISWVLYDLGRGL